LRKEIKQKLTEKSEYTISPVLWAQLNPCYSLEDNNKTTSSKEHYGKIGSTPEMEPDALDKVYFRRKDQLGDYAEALFKSKVVISKK